MKTVPPAAALPLFRPGRRATCLAAILACAGPAQVLALEAFPARPITLIVPNPPGGSNDVFARAIGKRLGDALGQPVVVDNKAGAGGSVGAGLAARAQADGYTLLFVSSTYTTNAAIQTNLPFDPVHAFTPVAMVAKGPMILTVNNELPVKTPQELLARAKSQPGKLNYASSGVGSINHFATHQYAQVAGVQMTHVPYKGMAPAINDLIGGHIQVLIASGPSILPSVKAGKVRALGVTSATPSAVAPGLAPLAANGAPGYESGLWWGILAPAGTPAPVVARLNTEINRILGQDEIKDLLLREGAEPDPKTPDAFGAQLRGDIEQWRRIAQQANIKAE
ncbi:tripartite tricarboxylate transporter substrate binding protein [Pigmentiphaga sp. GD03639]|uniref:Bug family tripartite tricarboxylate transporter substrate binding protein n=1 Tax=Pigmentiphaga sp. GD03639 TaxID=2975354 RepID=UPI0024485501|nr:tripartite tricarboxylate transporter substrate binding protein [Pigmentiphaga sp. GD03639]MDH2236304.1 tripartite tricarboxylate transporter substrate binding protein [Pigmentiphaga sp. GD03639]